MKRISIIAFFVTGVLALTGCTGPAGPNGGLGPTGATGASVGFPIYTFQQNFDGAGYLPASQFSYLIQNGGSGLSISSDSSIFVSASESLDVTGAAGANSVVYTISGVVPYSASNGDLNIESHMNWSGISNPSVKVEFVFALGGKIVADFGYLEGGSIYLYNDGTVLNEPGTGSAAWHDVRMVYHRNGLSDYYFDGQLLGQNFDESLAFTFAGSPNVWVGWIFPASLGSNDYFHIDNLQTYHY